MKKIFMFLLVALMWGSQMVFGQLGGWFKWSDGNYLPSAKDYADIVSGINSEKILANKWYSFEGREEQYKVLHPVEWRDLVLECYQSDDSTVTKENLSQKIASSEEVKWGDDISAKTKNYYWSKKEEIDYVPDYSGVDKRVPILITKGRPKIKQNCGNPQGNTVLFLVKPKPEPKPEPKASCSSGVTVNITNNNTVINNNYQESERVVYDNDLGHRPYGGYQQQWYPNNGGYYVEPVPRLRLGIRIGKRGRPMVVNNYQQAQPQQPQRPNSQTPRGSMSNGTGAGDGRGSMSGGGGYTGGNGNGSGGRSR